MPHRKSKIKVLIADDHAILRSGLKMLVNAQSDMEVVAEAPDGTQAVQAARESKPDVALMDLTMPAVGGMAAIRQIMQDFRETRVLVLTMHSDPAYLRSALAAGASGYVLKRSVDAELLAAIRAVHRGGVFVDPSLADVLVKDLLVKRGAKAGPVRILGEREFQVLRLISSALLTPTRSPTDPGGRENCRWYIPFRQAGASHARRGVVRFHQWVY